MFVEFNFKKAFSAACLLHLILLICLAIELHPKPESIASETLKKQAEKFHVAQPDDAKDIEKKQAAPETIKAVQLNNQEVMAAVQQLKNERELKAKQEQARQNALLAQAEMAKKKRIEEQQRIIKMRQEEERLALKRRKQMDEENKAIKELAAKKSQEAKRLETLKIEQANLLKKQTEESNKLMALQAQQAAEKANYEKEKALALAEKQKQDEAEQKARAARMSGEVNRYKAMIINAISRQWILPENADSTLSSKFRIRLAPNGGVLEVQLIRSSGDPILDRSAQTAIYKASPLPVPEEAQLFEIFRDITLTVRPEHARG